jgi:hypothetical protein
LAISLDGYEQSIAEEMMAAGRLPALAAMRERSARFRLDHGPARRTGLGAEHVSSGMSPEDGQRWSSIDFDSASYRVIQDGPKFSPFPAAMKARTVVLDFPYFDLLRAPDVKGISAWGAHDAGTELSSNPPELVDELLNRFGPYPAKNSLYAFAWPAAEKCRISGTELVRGLEKRSEIALWLLQERYPNWDLALIGVSESHSALEALWHGYDARHPLHRHASASAAGDGVRNVYESIDRLVGELAAAFEDATIVVFSMHGMGPNHSDVASMVLLPELLYRNEFGEPFFEQPAAWTDAADGIPILQESERWQMKARSAERSSSPVRDFVGRLIPQSVKKRLKSLFGHQNGPTYSERKRSLEWIPAAWLQPAWPRMRAFALPSFYDGRVRINLRGRERKGLVPLGRYEAVCEEIVALLNECRDPSSGDGVVECFEYCHRDRPLELNQTAADITVVWKRAALAFEHPRLGRIGPVPFRRTGGHTGPFGMAYIASDRIGRGDHGERSSFDVVPTLFDLLGERPPPHISGQSLLRS